MSNWIYDAEREGYEENPEPSPWPSWELAKERAAERAAETDDTDHRPAGWYPEWSPDFESPGSGVPGAGVQTRRATSSARRGRLRPALRSVANKMVWCSLIASAGLALTAIYAHGDAYAESIPMVLSDGPANHAQWAQLHRQGFTAVRYTPVLQFLPDGSPDNVNFHLPVFSLSDEAAFAADAHAAGLGVWVVADNLAYSTTPAELAQTTALCRQLSPLDMIHGADEPIHWRGLSVGMLLPAYRACHRVSNAPWATIEPGCGRKYICPSGRNAQLASYNAVSDQVGSDQNPVAIRTLGHVHLHVVGQNTARMHAIGGKRKVWAALQLCSAGSRLPGDPQIVMPTAKQLRFEAADAIANGATAFSIYGVDLRKCMTNLSDEAQGWNWHGYRARMKPAVDLIERLAPNLGGCSLSKKHGDSRQFTCGHVQITLNTTRFTFETREVH